MSDVERVAVPRETVELLNCYLDLLRAENERQNLVSAATLDDAWNRHILDSAQLARFEPHPGASWVDIGSGAGLPGIVLAALVEGPVTLVEPRRLRAEFLASAIDELGLGNAEVRCAKIERVTGHFDVITARAVAPLDRILHLAHHLSHPETVWVLPKGRNAKSELAEAQRSWQCQAAIEASCTDPDSAILVLSKVGAGRRR